MPSWTCASRPRHPEPLSPYHRLESFNCGKSALNDWLLRYARQAQASGSAKTFVVTDDGLVAGYYSLTVGQVDQLEAPERIRGGLGQYPVPAVILARLAVSLVYQGRGLGRGMLQDAIRRTLIIAEQAGIRALLAHPLDEEGSTCVLVLSPRRFVNGSFCSCLKTHGVCFAPLDLADSQAGTSVVS